MSIANSSHRRLNPLTGQWILVSPHRTLRPWQGRQEQSPDKASQRFEPDCYLCPGNERAGGHINAEYDDTFVFDNDFSALAKGGLSAVVSDRSDRLFQQKAVEGACRVVCFSPRHDLTLAQLPLREMECVIETWSEQTKELGRHYEWVQIFENKGEIMGCSNPHPHGQIWASNQIPDIPGVEASRQAEYKKESGGVLLLDYLQRELQSPERIVVETLHWVAVVPYWATWPYETLLMPKRHVQRLPDLSLEERSDLADALKRLLARYDNLYETSFPYSMGWHGAPFVEQDTSHWQLHAHFFPPLLRSASVRKFMVGYEMLAESQRDITPEQAAKRLRAMPDQHYENSPGSPASRNT
jgi:UDPglucose--hexose-1-phosphate uridylyltransferase